MRSSPGRDRSRGTSTRVDSSFRRGNAVASRSQRSARAEKELRSARNYEAAYKQVKRRRFVQLVLLAALGFAVVFLLRMQVSGATIRLDNKSVETSKYETYVKSYLAQQVPLKQLWLVDATSLENALQANFPEAARVRVTRHLIKGTLELDVALRTPLFSWSDASKEVRYLDDKGVLFATPFKVNANKLISISDESGVVFDSGEKAVSATTTAFIGALPERLAEVYGKEKGRISKIVIPSSTRELRVYLKSQPYYLKLSTDRSVEAQMGELTQLTTYLKQKRRTPRNYVDLRIAYKAYYK